MVNNDILYKPIRDGLTLENLTKVRKYPEAGFRDGAPVAHLTRPHASNQVLTSNTADIDYKIFLDELLRELNNLSLLQDLKLS